MSNILNKQNNFIEKAITVHGDGYDYSKVEYNTAKTNVCIICKEHGAFFQTPSNHLQGSGCPLCSKKPPIDKLLERKNQFIEKAKLVHKDENLDYSKVEYVNNKTKVCIIDHDLKDDGTEYGEYWQIPNNHLCGKGHPLKGEQRRIKESHSNTEDFITKGKIVHKDENLDYSKVEYINSNTKVCIIDNDLDENGHIYGEYWVTPSNFLQGRSHPLRRSRKTLQKRKTRKLAKKRYINIEAIFIRFKEAHIGENLDYSEVDYVDMHTKVKIIDHDLREDGTEYGEYWQTPKTHLRGFKHPDKPKNYNTSNKDTFIKKAMEIHGDKYDYSKVKYVNAKIKLCIICEKHGEFWQNANNHLSGNGCPKCAHEFVTEKSTWSTSKFISNAKIVHGDKFDYSKVEYVNCKNKVTINCPIHGEFWQTPEGHLCGHGCPKCAFTNSKAEEEVSNYVTSLGIEVIRNDKKILNGLELDMFIPSKNIAIEYNGLHWHTEEFGKDKYYHLNKTLECKKQGINLIHIFEDEYLEHKEVVLNKLKHILGVSEELTKIMGRKCKVEEVDTKTAMDFLNEYHIQGYGSSTVHLGAVYGNELIAVMSFKKESKESLKWELTRFASNIHYVCQGIGGKLFQHFLKTYNPSEVKSFADRRWTLNEESNLYTKLGFELVEKLRPEYRYVVGDKRKHKFGFRKQILHKKYGLSLDMTESEMVSELGFSKIWDCGLLKYVWKRE